MARYGLTIEEYAELRYKARKRLDKRLNRLKPTKRKDKKR